jgi:hypothetical protein
MKVSYDCSQRESLPTFHISYFPAFVIRTQTDFVYKSQWLRRSIYINSFKWRYKIFTQRFSNIVIPWLHIMIHKFMLPNSSTGHRKVQFFCTSLWSLSEYGDSKNMRTNKFAVSLHLQEVIKWSCTATKNSRNVSPSADTFSKRTYIKFY